MRTRFSQVARVFMMLLGVTTLTVSAGEVSKSQTSKYVLRIAGGTSVDDVRYEAVKYLIDKLPAATGGRVTAEGLYGTVGDEPQLLQRLKLGTIEGYIGSTGPIEGATNESAASLYDIPYLFKDWNSLYKVAMGPIGQSVSDKVAAKGIRILDYISLGNRALYTFKPIRTPADLAGLKVRVLPNPMYVALYKELGAVPVAMPFGEVYTALQTGALDGADGALGSGWASKHYEVSKYVTYLGNYLVIASVIAVSDKWWQSLPADLRAAVLKTVHEAALHEHQIDDSKKSALEAQWANKGVQLINVDRGQFIAIARKTYPLAETKVGAALIQQAMKAEQ